MDFPKSMPDIGLVNGQFVGEDITTGQVGSYIPSSWGNAVTQEILNVIEDAELVPDERNNTQLSIAINKIAFRSQSVVRYLSSSKTLLPVDLGLVVINAESSAVSITLPPSNSSIGVRDVILRRSDNTGNRLNVMVTGNDKIKLHTHLNAAGYPFFVLMGAGDWWHLRSDGFGSWWPVGRNDPTPLGRIVFDTTGVFPPGGYGPISGSVFIRSEWPWLWDHAQQSGCLVAEAARLGNEGGWTSGDGALTFRGPEGRGDFLRVLDESRGVDSGRVAGSWQKGTFHNVGALPWTDSVTDFANVTGATAHIELGLDDTSLSLYPAARAGNGGGENGLVVPSRNDLSFGIMRPRNIAYPGRIKLI